MVNFVKRMFRVAWLSMLVLLPSVLDFENNEVAVRAPSSFGEITPAEEFAPEVSLGEAPPLKKNPIAIPIAQKMETKVVSSESEEVAKDGDVLKIQVKKMSPEMLKNRVVDAEELEDISGRFTRTAEVSAAEVVKKSEEVKVSSSEVEGPVADWRVAEKILLKNKFDRKFIQDLQKNYKHEQFAEVLRYNFSKPNKQRNVASKNADAYALSKIQHFLNANQKNLAEAEKTYGIPPTVIASMIWTETGFQEESLRFHLGSYFVHLLQAERSDVLEVFKKGKDLSQNKKESQALRVKAKTLAAAAVKELKAVEKIYKSGSVSLREMKGPESGTVGRTGLKFSQLVLVSISHKKKDRGFQTVSHSEILTMAKMLKSLGWNSKVKKAQVNALKRYHGDDSYANHVLKLARLTDQETSRGLGLDKNKKNPRGRRDFVVLRN